MDETRHICRLAESKRDCFLNSPVAAEMGVTYPFIQGAMSWITDVPEFSLKIAEAGGLPTVALGLMDEQTLEQRLGRLPEIMGEYPYTGAGPGSWRRASRGPAPDRAFGVNIVLPFEQEATPCSRATRSSSTTATSSPGSSAS